MAADPNASQNSFGIYVHFPWCRRVCTYCDFNVHIAPEIPHAAFTDALLLEWQQRREDYRGFSLHSVFLGGGTPSMWAPRDVDRFLSALRRVYGELGEVSLEANPEDAELDRFEAYVEAGVNRFSLGVQSLDGGSLDCLGRAHDTGMAGRAVAIARDAGAQSVSVDLLWGLPEPLEGFEETISTVCGWAVDHVSFYNLTVEPGTALARRAQRGEFSLLADAPALARHRWCHRQLQDAHMQRYEVSSFAKAGHQSRHNLLYWTLRPYLGLGPGAHSFLPSPGAAQRWWNVRAPKVYMAQACSDARQQIEELSAQEQAAEGLMMGLRLIGGVNLQSLASRVGLDLLASLEPELTHLQASGLVVWNAALGNVAATDRGFEVLDAVILKLVQQIPSQRSQTRSS